MIVGIVGVPPLEVIREYVGAGARLIDLDEPVEEFPVRDIYLPSSFCFILKRVVSNIISLRENGRLDLVLASVGECKCDGMRNIARRLQFMTDVPVLMVKNENMKGRGFPISTSSLPVVRKMELIVASVADTIAEGIEIIQCEPSCGFWGVPPADFSILSLFPDDTHIYGWTRCMENGTPADLSLECHVDPGIPTLFFCQSFCQKSVLAHNLAKTNGGLFIEVDKRISRSTRAKIEAFLEFNVHRKRK